MGHEIIQIGCAMCLCGVAILYGYYVCVGWLFSMGAMRLCGVAVLCGYYVSVWSGCSVWVLCVCVEWLFSMGAMCLCREAVLYG